MDPIPRAPMKAGRSAFSSPFDGDEGLDAFEDVDRVTWVPNYGRMVPTKFIVAISHLATHDMMGHHEEAKKLLAKSVFIDSMALFGTTALCEAAVNDMTSLVVFLIANGASLSVKEHSSHSLREGETPLTLAGRRGHMNTFRVLVEAGVPVNVRSGHDGETPLISAARSGFFAGVQLLISHGGGSLRIEDVADDEFPLLLGTLETMKTLCETTFEFESMCLRVVERFNSQLQHWESPDHEVQESAMVSVASIVFRMCTLLFEIQKRRKPLSRFIGSRAIASRIRDFHEELNQFAERQGQALDGKTWDEQLHKDCLEVQLRLEELLIADAELKVGFPTHTKLFQAPVLLQNEVKIHEKEGNREMRDSVQRVLDRYLRVNTLRQAPPVPDWFVSRDDVEFHSWNKLQSANDLEVYEGKWRKSNVVIERGELSPIDKFEQAATTWYSLNHPNVVRLYGACHVKFHRFFVIESVADSRPLYKFLSEEESNRARKWKCLYEAARGLEYLHNQGVIHGDLRRENIIVGSDLATRLHGIGVALYNIRTHDPLKFNWVAPEIVQCRSIATTASDVYAFGMCIWEAVTSELPWKDADSRKIEANLMQGKLPEQPAAMDDAVWDLIEKMCAADPSERMLINRVVTRLKQFDINHSLAQEPADTELSDNSKGEQIGCEGLEAHMFPELDGGTIQDTFERIQAKRDLFPDNQWMFELALPALVFISGLLQERHQAPSDVEVVSFCRTLYEFEQLLRLARARSRKVAETHDVVYTKLDQLLGMLDVPRTDPIRLWRRDNSRAGVKNQPPYIGFADPSSNGKEQRGGNKESSAVSLELFDPSAPSHHSWTQQGLAASVLSSLAWYRSLKDLVFSESQKIGKGSFGIVCKGSWLDTPVVIKFMGYDGDAKTVSTDLLLHEVRVWHRLSHPHVLKFYGACHIDKRYFVCEYASNGELRDYLRKPGNEHLVWQKMYEAALGLQYLHSQNVAHNDLKCDNIMVGVDGKVKLIDFGLSALLGEAEIKIDVKKMGAVNWRSPEYLAGGRPSIASDVYSLAMCIIEVVSGGVPWGETVTTAIQIRYQWRKGNGPNLPDSMTAKQKNLIRLMTKLDPSEREPLRRVVDKLDEFGQEALAERAP